jgi:hypothetical protein
VARERNSSLVQASGVLLDPGQRLLTTHCASLSVCLSLSFFSGGAEGISNIHARD